MTHARTYCVPIQCRGWCFYFLCQYVRLRTFAFLCEVCALLLRDHPKTNRVRFPSHARICAWNVRARQPRPDILAGHRTTTLLITKEEDEKAFVPRHWLATKSFFPSRKRVIGEKKVEASECNFFSCLSGLITHARPSARILWNRAWKKNLPRSVTARYVRLKRIETSGESASLVFSLSSLRQWSDKNKKESLFLSENAFVTRLFWVSKGEQNNWISRSCFRSR